MRLRSACLCLIVIAAILVLASCGSFSTHNCPVTAAAPCPCPADCLASSFVFATTAAGKVLIFPVGQGGALGAPSSIPGPAIAGGSIAATAQAVFVADHVLNTLSVWVQSGNSFSQASGSPYSLPASAGAAEGVTTNGGGNFVYVAGFGGGISAFAVGGNSALTAVPGSPFPVAAGTVEVLTDESGKFLFAVSGSSVSAFTIDLASGALTSAGPPIALSSSSLATPGMAVVPSAAPGMPNFLYVTISSTNSVDGFSIDTTTGALSPVNGSPFPAGAGPLAITAAPSGIYVTNSLDGTISAFTWDQNTGALSGISGSPFTAPWGAELVTLRGNLYVSSVNNLLSPPVDAILGYSIGTSGALTPLAGSPYQAGAQLWGGLAAQ